MISAIAEQDRDRIMLNSVRFKHASFSVKLLAEIYRTKHLPELQLYLAIHFLYGPKFRLTDVIKDDRILLLTRTKSQNTLFKRLMKMLHQLKWIKVDPITLDHRLTPILELFPDVGFSTPKKVTIRAFDLPTFKDFIVAACIGNIKHALPLNPEMAKDGTFRFTYYQEKEGRVANKDVQRLLGYKSRSMASRVKCKALRGRYYDQFLTHLLKPNQIKGITYFENLADRTRKGGTR